MAMNFAPYQSSPPESDRAKSPPPFFRSPPASPKPHRARPTAPVVPTTTTSRASYEDPWAVARNQRLPSPTRYADGSDDETGDLAPASRRPFYNDYIGDEALEGGGATALGGRGGARGMSSIFETSLGLNLGVEACLAYLLLPPAGGVVLLLFEHKSDYVRFHAWQSALLFSALFLLHIIFSWTTVISWMLFVADLFIIAYLAYGAWRYAETLDRVEVPIFGRLASSFVDDE